MSSKMNIIALLGGLIALFWLLQSDPGYVLIYIYHTSLEMTVWALFIALVLTYIAVKLLLSPLLWPKKFHNWHYLKDRQQIISLLKKSALQLACGQWQKAEQTLKKLSKHSETHALALLGASFSAFLQKKSPLKYLNTIQSSQEEEEVLAATLLQGLMHSQPDQEHYQQLKSLVHSYPNHSILLSELCKISSELQLWPELHLWIQHYIKHIGPLDPELTATAIHGYSNLLISSSIEERCELWSDLPLFCQYHPSCIEPMFAAWIAHNQESLCHSSIKQAFKKTLSMDLLRIYTSATLDPQQQFNFLNLCLKKQGEYAEIYENLSISCQKLNLDNQAKQFMEKAFQLKPSILRALTLFQMLEKNNNIQAQQYLDYALQKAK
jgi:uncharacterized protein HemY